jgi:hypothetical protein
MCRSFRQSAFYGAQMLSWAGHILLEDIHMPLTKLAFLVAAASEIARRLGIGRASVYRVLGAS